MLLENHVASSTNPPPCQRVTLNIPKKSAFFLTNCESFRKGSDFEVLIDTSSFEKKCRLGPLVEGSYRKFKINLKSIPILKPILNFFAESAI